MFRQTRHISLTLLVLFLFPIVYQSVHIVSHLKHGTCDHSCSFLHNESEGFAEVSPRQENDDPCPVCQYQFSVNSPGTSFCYSIFLPASRAAFEETITAQTVLPVPTTCPPRAPPV